MANTYAVKFLPMDKVPQAFPVMQNLVGLSLDRWQRYARSRVEAENSLPGSTGIVAIENQQGYIHGLFGYRVDMDLRCGQVLLCEYLVALGLFDAAAVLDVLVEAMESLARDKRCGAIHVRVPQPPAQANDHVDGRLIETLRCSGHAVETLELCRPLAPLDGQAAAVSAGKEGDDR